MKDILFFDLEWVPIVEELKDLVDINLPLYKAWINRCDKWQDLGKFPNMTYDEIWNLQAGLNSEYIKIIVASFGFFNTDGEFKIESIYGDDEESILLDVKRVLDGAETYRLCGHAIKRFDMPFLAKRMLSHGIKLPYLLNNYGVKPWNLTAIDTTEMWGCGVMAESYTPIDTICASLGIHTPKDGISGKHVKGVYYDGGLQRIREYCEKDVNVVKEVYIKIKELIG